MYLPNVGDTCNYKKITIKMHYTKPLPQDHYERLGRKTHNNYKGDCSEVWAANDDGSFTCVWCRPYHLPSTMVMRYFNKYKGYKKSPGYTFSYKLVMPNVTLKFRGKGRPDASRAKHPDESYTSGPMGLQQPNFIHIITVAILLINMGEPGMSPGKYYIHIREKRQTFKIQ